MADPLHDKEDTMMRYLDGEMDDQERKQFEELLEDDTQLKAEMESLRLAVDSVKHYGLNEKIRAIHKEIRSEVVPAKTKVITMRRFLRYGVSVAAILILAFVGIEGYKFYHLTTEQLYNESYIAYDISATRGEVNEVPAIEKAYASKNYQKVIQEAKAKSERTDREQFLAALSFLQISDFSSSIKWFEALNRQGNVYQPDAEFYLSLSYLRNKDYDRALEFMEKINEDTSHPYHSRISDSLLRKIRMLKWK